MEKLEEILFYSIDKGIRSYRQYAQKRIKNSGFSITIDQWLVIKAIIENPSLSQNEIAPLVFKDNASITRIISNLKRDGYIVQGINAKDRRRTDLCVTSKGVEILQEVKQIVLQNRDVALKGISDEEIRMAKYVMTRIYENTKK